MTAPVLPLDAAEVGFFERLKETPEVVEAIGTDATDEVRAGPGHWTDTENPADYPRVAFHGQDRPFGARRGRGAVLLKVDMYVWHEGEDPDAQLGAVDSAIYAACADQWWRSAGRRLTCIDEGATSWPSLPGRPLRRTRTYRVFVS